MPGMVVIMLKLGRVGFSGMAPARLDVDPVVPPRR